MIFLCLMVSSKTNEWGTLNSTSFVVVLELRGRLNNTLIVIEFKLALKQDR